MFDGQEGGVSSIVHTIKSFQGATNVEVAGGLVVVPGWGATRSGIQMPSHTISSSSGQGLSLKLAYRPTPAKSSASSLAKSLNSLPCGTSRAAAVFLTVNKAVRRQPIPASRLGTRRHHLQRHAAASRR